MLAETVTPFTLDWFDQHGWELAITLAIAIALTVVSRRWVRRYRKRARAGGDDAEGRRRGGPPRSSG